MTTAAAARLRLTPDTTPGLPKLPHIPEVWSDWDPLTPEQQEENLLHVALWIVERDLPNFNMFLWHGEATHMEWWLYPHYTYESCGTVHCIAGFAQVMAGAKAFNLDPGKVGVLLLGPEAGYHFNDTNSEGLAFLKAVIARNS